MLVDAKISQRMIAERVGRSQPHVNRRLSLLKLPDDALAAIDADELPIKDAEQLAGFAAEHIPALWRRPDQRRQ